MIFRYIEEQRGTGPIVRLCHALGVSTSGYYAWRQRGPSPRAQANATLLVQLRAIHQETRATYGSRRMQAELVARGQSCSVNRVARLTGALHRMCALGPSHGPPQASLSREDDSGRSGASSGTESSGPTLRGQCP